jgi:hypothetical protein
MLKLFTPFFGNLSPGLIIVFLCCYIRRAFITNETTISYYFLHISSLYNTNTTNGTQASVYWRLVNRLQLYVTTLNAAIRRYILTENRQTNLNPEEIEARLIQAAYLYRINHNVI